MPESVSSVSRPSKKWSIVAWGAMGAAAVVLSYLVFFAAGLLFLSCPLLVVLAIEVSNGQVVVISLVLAVLGVIMGLTILWSLVPRRDKLEVDGVPIDLSQETRLCAEIASIASALNEAMPDEIYLIGKANAFVAQRGGWMGMGSRRIMGLGLPLMQVLSVTELRAILAHEFAHFYAGDTRLGPWVYQARKTMVRVFQNLNKRSEIISTLIRFAIVWLVYTILIGSLSLFWKFFMWLTMLISRKQEYRCDEIACHIAGSEPLVEALLKIEKSNAMLGLYWSKVVMPVATSGYQPQLADGFGRFITAPQNAKAAADYLEAQVASTHVDTLDTHPPLSGRIAKARSIGVAAAEADERPSISLIENVATLEAELLRKLIPQLKDATLKPMHWETAGAEIYVPLWRKQIEGCAGLFSQETLASLPELVKGERSLAGKILNPKGMLLNRTQREERADALLIPGVALALMDGGWALHMQPGVFYLQRDEFKIEPKHVVFRLKDGSMSVKEWQRYCTEAGISDWPLARMSQAAAPPVNQA